jgi:hypothetical protein
LCCTVLLAPLLTASLLTSSHAVSHSRRISTTPAPPSTIPHLAPTCFRFKRQPSQAGSYSPASPSKHAHVASTHVHAHAHGHATDPAHVHPGWSQTSAGSSWVIRPTRHCHRCLRRRHSRACAVWHLPALPGPHLPTIQDR